LSYPTELVIISNLRNQSQKLFFLVFLTLFFSSYLINKNTVNQTMPIMLPKNGRKAINIIIEIESFPQQVELSSSTFFILVSAIFVNISL